MSSVVLNESIIWATGGMSNNGQLKSTEIVSFDQPVVPGPDLKFTVSHHAMVLVNPRTIYLPGGYQDGETSGHSTFHQHQWQRNWKCRLQQQHCELHEWKF